jgi:hypothetical protein
MPELFLAPYIFDHLGGEFTFTLETSARQLIEWHGSVKDSVLAQLLTKKWCIDLVLYEGPGAKQDMAIHAVIELKNGWFSDELVNGKRSDLDKLTILLEHLAGCRYGVMAASVPGWERDKKKARALEREDAWTERRIKLPEGLPDDQYFCVWLLEAGKGSLAPARG